LQCNIYFQKAFQSLRVPTHARAVWEASPAHPPCAAREPNDR
jgi:hypothetical protein